MLLRVIGVKPNDEPPVTEEEVRVLIEQGREHGVFDDREQMMIENVFALDDLRVSEIMTPRTKIEWLDLNDSSDVQFSEMSEKMYSCFVVAENDLEHVSGIVYTKRYLLRGCMAASAICASISSSRCTCRKPCTRRHCLTCSR